MQHKDDTADSKQTDSRPLYWVTAAAGRRAVIALHVVAIAAVLIEFLFPFPEDTHAVERAHALDFTGSYSVYGFVSCVILVLLGRILRQLVMRGENYYRDSDR
ncbi:MAG: hypothetical protein WD078_07070 [Woeseia sp.]